MTLSYQNPVIADNCPDPAVVHIAAEDRFYVVCTTNDNRRPDKFPLWSSSDLIHWQPAGFVFPRGQLPTWAVRDFWAPEIHRIEAGYVAYFSARDQSGLLCIGAATAERIEGPWTDLGQPLLRDPDVGLIDAHQFEDHDGRRYLYWKEDGNGLTPPRPSVICGQALESDGLTLHGQRAVLLTNDRPWEDDVVEGPWLVHYQGGYFLFYAGSTFNSTRYATGVARASSPLGSFSKHPEPILASGERFHGPGHGSVVTVAGESFFVYHAWEAGRIDEQWDVSVHPRMMLIDRIEWVHGWPRIADGTPSTTPMRRPATAP